MTRLATRDDRQAGGLDLATAVVGEREVLVPESVRHRERIDAVSDRQNEDRDLADVSTFAASLANCWSVSAS